MIFDNCSEEPLEAHVKALNDDRIRFFRSDVFLPVTDSWNQAFPRRAATTSCSSGMMTAAPNFFEELTKLIDYFDVPDRIYCSFYQFFHPGVAPWQRSGYVSDFRNGFFFSGREPPFVLSPRDECML